MLTDIYLVQMTFLVHLLAAAWEKQKEGKTACSSWATF